MVYIIYKDSTNPAEFFHDFKLNISLICEQNHMRTTFKAGLDMDHGVENVIILWKTNSSTIKGQDTIYIGMLRDTTDNCSITYLANIQGHSMPRDPQFLYS